MTDGTQSRFRLPERIRMLYLFQLHKSCAGPSLVIGRIKCNFEIFTERISV